MSVTPLSSSFFAQFRCFVGRFLLMGVVIKEGFDEISVPFLALLVVVGLDMERVNGGMRRREDRESKGVIFEDEDCFPARKG